MAILNCAAQIPPEVDVFVSPPPHTTFTLAIAITSDVFTAGICCIPDAIEWTASDNLHLWHWADNYQATVAPVALVGPLQMFARSTPPKAITLNIPSKNFTPLTLGSGPDAAAFSTLSKPVYDQSRDAFLYTPDQYSLALMDLRTGASVYVLALQPGEHITDVEWLPDGRRALIVIGADRGVDCALYAVSDVYLWTRATPPPRHLASEHPEGR